jgi:hypothetical protein
VSSEDQPHFVYPKDRVLGSVEMFPDYVSAFHHWRIRHAWDRPYTIATLGRECTPAAAIVDVNE